MRLHERGYPQFAVWNHGVGLLPSAIRFKVTAMNLSPFANLNSRFGGMWAAIGKAVAVAENQREALRDLICGNGDELRTDANFVVFGSLARGESTAGSDVDWSLLIDGQTDPADMEAALRIEKLLRDGGWKHPGPSGIFGSLAFSHSLVHDIGGGADNYVNTTRRMLLLLESRAIGDTSVRDRVIRALLARYLEQDTHFHPRHGSRSFVPRFLLNDLVRYWRTIAVDYANKTHEPDGTKWAVRNIKLRMSRKLIFVAGLLMCFLCQLEQERLAAGKDLFGQSGASNAPFIDFLAEIVNLTPLDLLARVSSDYEDDTIHLLFDSYDRFLAAMDDPEQRKHLEKLNYQQSREDAQFNALRDVSRDFQEGLRRLFFESDHRLAALSQIYAIF